MIIRLLRKVVPKPIFKVYHFVLAKVSAFIYRYPSNNIIVIGVTGTNGKSSTIKIVAQILGLLGQKVGYTSTAGFSICDKEIENKMKMTMPGRFFLQRILRQMVKEKCRYAILETSSEGIVQYRHIGINYDLVTYTNLTPEHIERHGSFENYKKAKGELFAHLSKGKGKNILGEDIKKTIVVNADEAHASYFLSFDAERRVTYSVSGRSSDDHLVFRYKRAGQDGLLVKVNDQEFLIPYIATFQQQNAMQAVTILYSLGFSLKQIAEIMPQLKEVAGRFERIQMGQDFEVIVDYAYEPYALTALLDSTDVLRPGRIIGIHGSAGGGRDKARREKIGFMAGEREDIVIITNEDPYDEDPREIIEQVANGAVRAGKKQGQDLFLVDDRAKAIEKAINMARKDDLVLITGKGSETVMAVAHGKKVPWNDREQVEKILKKIL